MPPVEAGKRRFVLVGWAAMRSLRAESRDPNVKPASLANSNERYGLIETNEFPGWAVVDRPMSVIEGGGGGKWPQVR